MNIIGKIICNIKIKIPNKFSVNNILLITHYTNLLNFSKFLIKIIIVNFRIDLFFYHTLGTQLGLP